MKKNVIKLWIVLFIIFSVSGIYAEDVKEIKKIKKVEKIKKLEVQIDGAEPGKWTMDYDAGLKLAKDKKLPVLINFTGSDWCGWCRKMQIDVFSKKGWQDYAERNLVLITIDFPKDKATVPEKYKKRNKQLSDKFGVKGYPSYIILDDDGKTRLGKLSASRRASPRRFKKKLRKKLFRRKIIQIEFNKSLSQQEREKYKRAKAKLKLVKGSIKRLEVDYRAEKESLDKKEDDYEEAIEKFRIQFKINSLMPKDRKRYLTLKKKLKIVREEAILFIKKYRNSKKKSITKENYSKKKEAYLSQINKISGDIDKYDI